jgi:hypothetical protein
MHPYTAANVERSAYKKLGETAYMQTKQDQFVQSEAQEPAGFVRRAAKRFTAAAIWYTPFDRFEEWQIPEWVFLRRLIYPLPFMAMVLLAVSAYWRPLGRGQWTVLTVYALYLLPYVSISYYDRYSVPLCAVKALLVIWGAQRLLALWPRAVPELQSEPVAVINVATVGPATALVLVDTQPMPLPVCAGAPAVLQLDDAVSA